MWGDKRVGRRAGAARHGPRRWVWALALGALLVGCGGSGKPTPPPGLSSPPTGPTEQVALRVPSGQDVAALTEERRLTLPVGLRIAVFAAGMGKARFLAWSPEGDLVVSEMLPADGKVLVWPDRDRDGVADGRVVFAAGLRNPHGLAFRDGYLYVAEERRVVRLRWRGAQPAQGEPEVIVPDLPTGGHYTRTIAFGPDGRLYLAIGSSCNVCSEADNRRAAIMAYDADGGNGRPYARGLRNAVGLAWRPGTAELWATNNGRDGMGDDLPPETINLVRDGADFGWPYCHNGTIRDPQYARLGSCDGVARPAFAMQAHSAPLGLAFAPANAPLADLAGDLVVAFHGSWNRSTPTGYKVIRARFADGQPTGRTEDLITGWLGADGRAWGRPADVSFGPDGALYVSDDALGVVYVVRRKA